MADRGIARAGLMLTVACLVSVAAPAWADTTGDVDATVNVTGGAISIAVPATADLGTGVPGGDSDASLGTVTVSDLRGVASAAWVATVTSTGFVMGAGGEAETIPASAIDYWSGPATATEGVATFEPGQPTSQDAVSLASARIAFRQDGGDGGGVASWNPTLTMHIPQGAIAGTYHGTVTHSAA